MKATLSSFSMEKFTSLKSRVPSIDFASPLTSRILLPGSRDGVKMIPGYRREEGCDIQAVRMNLSRARKRVREVFLQLTNERKENQNENRRFA
jgi:hypothetical protein